MISPIYFFTRSGCSWCKKMQPSIDEINNNLSDEQKIQIHNIDDEKSKSVYNSIVIRYKLKRLVPMLYNSNIGTYLLGYQDKVNIQQFLKANPLKEIKPLNLMPKFDIQNSSKKDFDNWKKSVILWYEENKNNLPSNVISKEQMMDMVYNQFMVYRIKPTNIEERISVLEEKVNELSQKIS